MSAEQRIAQIAREMLVDEANSNAKTADDEEEGDDGEGKEDVEWEEKDGDADADTDDNTAVIIAVNLQKPTVFLPTDVYLSEQSTLTYFLK